MKKGRTKRPYPHSFEEVVLAREAFALWRYLKAEKAEANDPAMDWYFDPAIEDARLRAGTLAVED